MTRTRLVLERCESRTVPSSLSTFDLVSGAAPRGIVSGPNDQLWFSEFGANRVGQIATSGAKTEYELPTLDSGPSDLTVGPDGNVWFTQTRAHRIGRVTPAGVVTEFTLPSGSEPIGIATGPDDRIWFTLAGTNRIGRLSPNVGSSIQIQASLVTFTVPTAASRPLDITSGADGALWFTESATDKIGRITTAGVVTNEYIVPGTGSAPRNIVRGPDNQFWFTQNGSDQIGRITTAGAVTEFTVPGTRNGLTDITVGKDKNLWFTQTDADQVGRITTAGTVTEFNVSGGPRAIVTGPDGFLWLSLERSNQIGRFGLAPPTLDLGADVYLRPGQTFTRNGSFQDDAGLNFSATVDYGFGRNPLTLDNRTFTLSQKYDTEGKFIVDVRIGNGFTTTSDRLTVIVDGTAPTADFSAATHATKAEYTFQVTYTDGSGVDRSTIGNGNLRIVGPNGYDAAAVLTSIDRAGNGSPRIATYRVPVPGSLWDTNDNGTYTVTLQSDQVKDLAGNAISGRTLGTFTVSISPPTSPPTSPPGVPPTTPPVVPPVPGVPPSPSPARGFAVGSDAGSEPRATLYGPDGKVRFSIMPFESTFRGGVRVATGDVNADGVIDLIVASGPGRSTEVRVFDGSNGKPIGNVAAFEPSFQGGLFVAAADFDGDQFADIVIAPDEGGGPRVRVFSGKQFDTVLADFFGIDDPEFRGGARVAAGDLDGDGKADLIVGAGFGGGPRIAGFNGASLRTNATPPKLFNDFFAFELTLRNGVYLAVGDLDADGYGDLVVGGGPGGGPRLFAMSGRTLLQTNNASQTQLANFFAGNPDSRGGVRVAITSFDGDAQADLLVGVGPGAGSRVLSYTGKNLPTDGMPTELLAFDAFPSSNGGVFVG